MKLFAYFFSRRTPQPTTTGPITANHSFSEEPEDDRFTAEIDNTVEQAKEHRSSPTILPQLLVPKEFESMLKDGIRIPSSVFKGRTYVIQLGKRIKVLEKRKVSYLCVGTRKHLIDKIDEYMSLYLNLVLNEKGLLSVANVLSSDYEGLAVMRAARPETLSGSWS